MKKLMILLTVFITGAVHAQEVDSSAIIREQIESSFNYQTGRIDFDSIGYIDVPEGFRYLDSAQSKYVLTELWGNPNGSSMGMLVPANVKLLDEDGWVFVISYDPMGYVEDDDADDIDYDDMMKSMKEEMNETNEARAKEGYPAIELIGWASPPYYDGDKKTLHWAKELKFGDNEFSTLNYNVRILGRRGVLIMNAVATMNELPQVKENIDKVHSSFSFGDGMKYSDFDPDIDEVAAWTIGGLVAGKLLAKAGFLAIILKYFKLILIGIAGLGGGLWKWFKSKKQDNPYASRDSGQSQTPG